MTSALVPKSVSTLEDICYVKICESLWLHRFTHPYLRKSEVPLLDLVYPLEAPRSIPIPEAMKKTLDSCLEIMRKQLKRWIFTHVCRVITPSKGEPVETLLSSMLHLVWRSDATIDYFDTAQKLLKSRHLSADAKFSLAGYYFFKDYFDELQPQLEETELKNRICPNEVLEVLLEISINASEYDIIKMHKRFDRFLSWWYDGDFHRTFEFKFIKLKYYALYDQAEEPYVRKLLLGLGYGVKV